MCSQFKFLFRVIENFIILTDCGYPGDLLGLDITQKAPDIIWSLMRYTNLYHGLAYSTTMLSQPLLSQDLRVCLL